MKSRVHTKLLNINDEEVWTKIYYNYFPAAKGKRDSLAGIVNAGPQLEPDSPASVDITLCRTIHGEEIALTEEQAQEVETEIFELMEN